MNALGNLTTTNTLLVEQLGTPAKPVNTAYIANLVPPIASDTLQQVCDTGNTTTTDIDMSLGNLTLAAGDIEVTTGKLITDEITAVTPNRTLTLKTYVKSLKIRFEMVAPSLIIPDECQYGNIVQIRSGTAPSTFTMPRAIEGGHLSIINTSGNAQRFVAATGETLDDQPPPTFISIPPTTPFSVEFRAGAIGQWYAGSY